ncbi:MAG: BrnA antitoxin family protein [Caulobacterales bacterium]|jgi:uncharacterized protein (DUF4415 family)
MGGSKAGSIAWPIRSGTGKSGPSACGGRKRGRPEGLSDVELAAFPNTKVRGRPRSVAPKAHVSLRLAPDVLAFYRAKGKGWQVEIEAALRRGMKD